MILTSHKQPKILAQERELMTQREALRNYSNAKVAMMAAADRFAKALEELKTVGDR